MSQNLRVATWVPADRVTAGESIISQNNAGPAQPVNTRMGVTAGGANGVTISTIPPVAPTVGDVWVDVSIPAAPKAKIFKQGNAWVTLADGQPMPKALRQDQLLHSGPGPNFDWEPEDAINLGNY